MPARNDLSYIKHEVLRSQIGTRAFANAGLAIGTTKSLVQNANAVDFCINNMAYTKAATDDFFDLSGLAVQAADTTLYYLMSIDSAGDDQVAVGTTGNLPAIPSGSCPVGYIKVVTVAVTFTPGTTLLDAAGVTVTYTNLSQLPLALV